MMKLYRPLCSDVTLRLTVDISPDEDDEDDVISKFNTPAGDSNCTCLVLDNNNDICTDNKENCSSIISRTIHRCSASEIDNQNHNHTNNHSHYSCHRHHNYNGSNWYARQNTPDKIAKDIYNKEHLLHGESASTVNLRTLPLDEFKRSVEEEGNDFKEVSLFDEIEAGGPNSERDLILGSSAGTSPRSGHSYVDAKLSGCFNDNARYQQTGCQEGVVEKTRDSNHTCYIGTNQRKRRKGNLTRRTGDDNAVDNDSSRGIVLWNERGPNDEDDDDDDEDDDDDDDNEDDDAEADDDDTLNMETDVSDEFDEDVARVPDQIAVDLDEDVDGADTQLMSCSMIESFYGEIEESLQTSMVKSGMEVEAIPDEMSKSIAEEIHDVLLGDDDTKTDDVFSVGDGNAIQLPFPYPFTLKHAGHLFDKSRHRFTSTSSRQSSTRSASYTSKSISDVILSPPVDAYSISNSSAQISSPSPVPSAVTKDKEQKKGCGTASSGSNKCSVSTMTSPIPSDLEVTHRGLHRFMPRHKDEISIGIGDPIHVIKECDDLWCEGINLRTNERGVFPAVYANDLTFLEESDDEDEYWKFSMRFLGSVEVTSHKGDDTLVQAIQKVAKTHQSNVRGAPCSALEISQYGIRMIDKSKEGHEKDAFSHFFALKNISFCGTHPKDNRYFAFITKHPRDYRFACHVFYGDRPTHRARDALGEAFKRFYQEYMAVTHPTEDIYIE